MSDPEVEIHGEVGGGSSICDREGVADPSCSGCCVCRAVRRELVAAGVDADREFERAAAIGVRFWLPDYARGRLPGVEPGPGLLQVWGSCPLGILVAVVGSRRSTAIGRRRAFSLGRELAGLGIQVVSGLARGIDGAVLEGAIAGGGSPVAILGSGFPRIYPPEHEELAQRLRDVGGGLVTEYPFGAPPRAAHFPQRNRLISGLSAAVVVVEASLKSGSLITAGWAARQGRDVMVFPGPVEGSTHDGCHRLIQEGAALVTRTEDIVFALATCTPGRILPADPTSS